MNYISKNSITAVLLILIVVMGVWLLFENSVPIVSQKFITPQKFIIRGITYCHEERSDQTSCYRILAEQVIHTFDSAATLRAMDTYEISQPLLFGCHIFLHFYGQHVAESAGSIGEKLAHGTPVCFAGYYHGVLEKYFLQHDLTTSASWQKFAKAIPGICVRNFFELHEDYRQCLHGLGHALMFATDSALPDALIFCDALSHKDEREMCYSGALMENSFSNTNPAHFSRYIKKDDPAYPCTILDTRYLPSCYQQQSGYLIGYYKGDWDKILNFCTTIPALYKEYCFNGVGQQLVGSIQSLPDIAKRCINDNEERGQRNDCMRGVLIALREAYPRSLEKTVTFCKEVPVDLQLMCMEYAIEIISSRTQNTDALKNVCTLVADMQLQNLCYMLIK